MVTVLLAFFLAVVVAICIIQLSPFKIRLKSTEKLIQEEKERKEEEVVQMQALKELELQKDQSIKKSSLV